MFVAAKLARTGFKEIKKHKAKKEQAKSQCPDPNYGPYPEPYPMSGYPQGVAPGVDVQYVPDAAPQSKSTRIVSMFTSALRFFQFVFGLAVIGLYGQDVHHDHEDEHTWHSKWVYAVIVGCLATSTAAVHVMLPFIIKGVNNSSNPKLQLPQFAWEFILCILWLTLFGIFGKMYIGAHPSTSAEKSGLGDASKINRMRHATWVDIVNLVMWTFTASWALMRWLKNRRQAMVTGFDAEKDNQI